MREVVRKHVLSFEDPSQSIGLDTYKINVDLCAGDDGIPHYVFCCGCPQTKRS